MITLPGGERRVSAELERNLLYEDRGCTSGKRMFLRVNTIPSGAAKLLKYKKNNKIN
jgi:hypothetical protein